VSLLASWVLFPSVLAVLALGSGLALERVAGVSLPGELLAPSGVAVMIVVAGFATLSAATAALAVPAVVTVAAAGLACAVTRGLPRRAGLPLAAGATVFCVYAAPVVLSGQATFAGYIKLDGTATFLALTDRVIQHGHSLAGLTPSSYEATLSINLGHGYPVGALLPFGIGRALVGVDGAWVYQPYLAFLAAMLALVLYELAGSVLRSARLRAVAAVVAAQPALLYGFALWGGIKELAAAPLVALVAALAPSATEYTSSCRSLVPLAAAVAALLGVLSVGGVVWCLAAAAVVAVLAMRGRRMALRAGALAGAVLLLSVPTLLDARSFLNPATETAVRSSTVLGNLVHPLSGLQVFGVWPTGDFRQAPSDLAAARILIGAVAVAALVGSVLAWRLRVWALLLYAGSGIAGCALVAGLASPWIVAKAYAIVAPAVVLAALVGCAGLVTRGRVTEGIVGLFAIAGGVLWSNALAYHEANLAPRPQLAELERIGHRFSGQGPALMTEYQPYGVRHFLRGLDAEGASELRRRCDSAPERRRTRQGRLRRCRRIPGERATRLPHAGATSLAGRRPPPGRLPTRLARQVLRRLAEVHCVRSCPGAQRPPARAWSAALESRGWAWRDRASIDLDGCNRGLGRLSGGLGEASDIHPTVEMRVPFHLGRRIVSKPPRGRGRWTAPRDSNRPTQQRRSVHIPRRKHARCGHSCDRAFVLEPCLCARRRRARVRPWPARRHHRARQFVPAYAWVTRSCRPRRPGLRS